MNSEIDEIKARVQMTQDIWKGQPTYPVTTPKTIVPLWRGILAVFITGLVAASVFWCACSLETQIRGRYPASTEGYPPDRGR